MSAPVVLLGAPDMSARAWGLILVAVQAAALWWLPVRPAPMTLAALAS